MFCWRRLELWHAYWREFTTYEKVIRITGENGAHEFVTLNGTDENGQKIYDLNAAQYDVTIEASKKSPTHRAKVQAQLANILQNSALGNDPVLASAILNQYIENSDLGSDTKEFVKQYSLVAQQQKQEQMQQQQAEAQQQAAAAEAQMQSEQQKGQADMMSASSKMMDSETKAKQLDMQAAEKMANEGENEDIHALEGELEAILRE